MHNQERPYAAQKSLRDLRPDVVQRRAHKQISLCKAVVQVFMRTTTRTTTAHDHAHNHENVGAQLPTSKAHNRAHNRAHNLRAQPAHNRGPKILLSIPNSLYIYIICKLLIYYLFQKYFFKEYFYLLFIMLFLGFQEI